MLFRQSLNEDLCCASYLVADGGEALVVDPAWDISPYLKLAAMHNLTITMVADTHVHADHRSGRGRLCDATGARAYLPVGADVRDPHDELVEGMELSVGGVLVTVVPTPGHRPEHVALLITDAGSDEPCLLLSGDSLLVGDAARPDLAVTSPAALDGAVRTLRRSLLRLSQLPDYVEVWPGHVGGSLCGGNGTKRRISSTIGVERRTNPTLLAHDEEAFVDELIARTPVRPPTVNVLVDLNRAEYRRPRIMRKLIPTVARDLMAAGAAMVDGRSTDHFEIMHVPGAVSVPLDEAGAAMRAAWLIDPEQPVVLLASSEANAHGLAEQLRATGFDNIVGVLSGGIKAWKRSGLPLGSIETTTVAAAAKRLLDGSATLLDVRDAEEHAALRAATGLHVPWRELRSRNGELPRDGTPLIVACASGRRTAMAASMVSRVGAPGVLRVAEGGIADLERYGVPIERAGQPRRRRKARTARSAAHA